MNQKYPIKVINLEHSKDRRAFIETQLNDLGLDFEFVQGVDGKNLSEKELGFYSGRDALKTKGRELSHGEIACLLSHIKIWKDIMNNNPPCALILEDDALVGKAFKNLICRENVFPEDWEYINFVTDMKLVPFGDPVHDIYRMARIKGISNGAVVYLLNSRGAEKLCRHVFPIRLPVDDFVGRTGITGLNLYSMHPQIASYKNFESVIWMGEKRSELRSTPRFKAKKFCNLCIGLLHKIKKRL